MESTQKIQNDHADEEIAVSGSQIDSNSAENNDNEFENPKQPMKQFNMRDFAETKNISIQGGYDASEYASLEVSNEIKELFKSIQRYTPVLSEIDTKLKPFIPDYIAAVGQVDAFLKMPRPDGEPETLGLNILDEPRLNQSDKAQVQLRLGTLGKDPSGRKNIKVNSIENAQKNPKQIMKWVESVGDVHKSKQPHTVSYSKIMPDIDSLMQVWPAQVEQMFSAMGFPSEDIDLSLTQYSKAACNLIDIPVHEDGNNSIIESLHVLFTLYSAFKENQHFGGDQDNESYMNQG